MDASFAGQRPSARQGAGRIRIAREDVEVCWAKVTTARAGSELAAYQSLSAYSMATVGIIGMSARTQDDARNDLADVRASRQSFEPVQKGWQEGITCGQGLISVLVRAIMRCLPTLSPFSEDNACPDALLVRCLS